MLIAIVSEVIGTLVMKSQVNTNSMLGVLFMYAMLVISYGFLAIAIKRIPLAVAYGIWESLGLVLICLFSMILFSEPLNLLKVGGIAAIIIGVLLLEIGTEVAISKVKKG